MVKKKSGSSLFSKNLASVIKNRGISQKAISEIAGVSASTVSEWLAGNQPADLGAVLKLCSALKLDFQWMMTGVHSSPNINNLDIDDLFTSEEVPTATGVFEITMRRLIRKKL